MRKVSLMLLGMLGACMSKAVVKLDAGPAPTSQQKTGENKMTDEGGFYRHTVKDGFGQDHNLSQYQGKVTLVVNVASKCGFTPQYDGLQKLYAKYKDQGFVVLGFPSNQFLKQEPGTDQEIQEFCRVNYGVEFPVLAKIDVKGKNIAAVYQTLTRESAKAFHGKVGWNFEKFLVDQKGVVVGRFNSRVKPEDKRILEPLEALLQ